MMGDMNGQRTGGRTQVVVPCFNDGHFLIEALESLGPGHAGGRDTIVVNDGSSDPRTLQVLDDLRQRGFHVIDRPNGGLAAARNTGWRATTGATAH